MNRGMFSFISSNPLYAAGDKEWLVGLDKCHRYWYDLIVNPGEVADYFDTQELIVSYLANIKKEVEEHLEKRFIYFICSRERVRFNVNKMPSYNPFTKKMKIHVLTGENKKQRSFKCTFVDVKSGKVFRPAIKLTDKYITMEDASGGLTTYSVHDFLEHLNIRLGLDSRVEYVGCTKNPHTRPTNGAHTGLSFVQHQIAEEKRDTLVYFNLFKVLTRTSNSNANVIFNVANAMSNEIDPTLEGNIIEKCFIFYFDSKNQNRNKVNERKELEGNLTRIASKNKIKAIHINYEFDEANEYATFSSSSVAANTKHRFTVKKEKDGISIQPGSKAFDELYQNL